jgi:hypothetical protein
MASASAVATAVALQGWEEGVAEQRRRKKRVEWVGFGRASWAFRLWIRHGAGELT